MYAVIRCVVTSAIRHGFRRIFVLNGHGGNTGLAAIPGINDGVYRWRQLSSRSPIGVIGDASTANAEKGEKLLAAISADVAEALVNDRLWSEPI